MRPRTNQRHFPAHDIEELRKLIDARPPQPAANARDPRIIADCLFHVRLLLHDCHRPEFEDPESPGVEAVAKPRKKTGPRESSLIMMAAVSMVGANKTNTKLENVISN